MSRQRRNKMHVYPDDWKPFPVKTIGSDAQQEIVSTVQSILDAKQADPDADVKQLEGQLDLLVDFLYLHQQGDETLEEWELRKAAEAASEIGEIRRLLERGEDETLEFKSTVMWDIYQDRHSTVMRNEVLKEICALLNAEGGTILCGVDDSGKVLGLRKDLKHAGNRDKLALEITNTFGDLLRPNPVELVKMRFIEIDGETILRLDVQGDPMTRYESPSTKKQDAGKNILRTHVRIHASAKALDVGDAISWWQRRSQRGGLPGS